MTHLLRPDLTIASSVWPRFSLFPKRLRKPPLEPVISPQRDCEHLEDRDLSLQGDSALSRLGACLEGLQDGPSGSGAISLSHLLDGAAVHRNVAPRSAKVQASLLGAVAPGQAGR